MKLTSILILALALCVCLVLPVAAMWNNGNWIDEHANDGYTIIHDMQTGVDSKYKPTEMLVEGRSVGDSMQGTLRGSIRCGYNTLTHEVWVRNDANPDGVNGTFTAYPINPDATFEIPLIPGSFTLMLKDGNGGQPEYSHARIVAGGISYPEIDMLGHAISSVAVEEPQCEDKVFDVTCKVKEISLSQWYNWVQFLHIKADYPNQHYNKLFGDPDYGTLKELRVVYKYEEFCVPFTECKEQGQRLVIQSAKYGTFCGETIPDEGYLVKSVPEDVDMDIQFVSSPS